MEVMKLLEELEELIENSSGVPFGNKVFLDKEDALEIIKEIRISLPDEFKQAEWINMERQRILNSAQGEADKLMENTKSYIQEQVENSEIVKEANRQAEAIIKNAEEVARQLRAGGRDYVDDTLEKLQKDLHKMITNLEKNRDELKRMKV